MFAKETYTTHRNSLKKQPPKSYFTGLRGGFLCSLEFYRTAIKNDIILSEVGFTSVYLNNSSLKIRQA